MGAEAPWLDEMVSLVGLKEIRGKKNEPRVVEFAKLCGHDEIDNDETPWCAFSLGACLVKSKRPTSMPQAINGMARSYLQYGTPCEPKRGAIAIWPRGKSVTHGHVNIVEEVHANGSITCVGGNQADKSGKSDGMVSRTTYTKAQVENALDFRWPPEKATTITVVKTAVKSRRFMGALTSFIALVFGAILDGMKSLVDSIGWLIDGIPGMTGEASSLISSNEQIMGWLGIPWAKVSLGIAASAMLYVAGRHIAEKVKGGAS